MRVWKLKFVMFLNLSFFSFKMGRITGNPRVKDEQKLISTESAMTCHS